MLLARLLLVALRLLGTGVGVVLALAFALVLWALDTREGLRFAVGTAQAVLGHRLVIGSANGRLLHDVELHDVRYTSSDGTVVAAARLHLKLLPRELAQLRLHVSLIEIDALDIAPAHTPPSTTPITMPKRLPFSIVVDQAALAGLTVRPTGEPKAPPVFAMQSAAGSASWIGTRIAVPALSATMDWSGGLRAHGAVRSGGDQLEVEELVVDGPGHLEAKGRYGFDVVASDLQLVWKDLHWPFVEQRGVAPIADAVTGSGRYTGGYENYHVTVDSAARLHGFPAHLVLAGSGGVDSVQVAKLVLDALDEQGAVHGSLQAKGDVAWSPALRAQLAIELAHLDPRLFGAGVAGDLNGRVTTTTTMNGEEPRIAFVAAIAPATLAGKPLALDAKGEADSRRVQLAQLLLKAGGGSIDAKGSVAWSPRLAPDLEATLAHLDPGQFVHGWNGDLNGRLGVTTANAGEAIDLALSLGNSRLRGYPLAANAHAQLAGETINIAELRLSSGSTRLEASGQATPPFALAGRFDSPDLAELLPELSGHAALAFQLSGSAERPHLVTHGEADGLRYREQRLAKLAWTGDLDPEVDSSLKLTASGLRSGDQEIRSLTLELSGKEVYHRAVLALDAEAGHAGMTLQGGYDRVRGEWGGELAALGLVPAGLAPWALEKGAGILIGQKRRALEPACVAGDGGQVCFELEQNVLADGARIGWDIRRLMLATFQPLLPPALKIAGSAEGKGQINFTGGDIAEAEAAMSLHEASFTTPDAPPLKLSIAELHADQREGRLHATAQLASADAHVDVDVAAAPGESFASRALSGSLSAEVPSLAFLRPLLPQLRNLDGQIHGSFSVGGTPGHPALGGELKLVDARAKLAVAGIQLEDVQFAVRGNGGEAMDLAGSLRSGGGAMELAGKLDPFLQPMRAELTVRGDNFQAMNTAEARAWVSPDLKLVRDAAGASLDGTLTVPRAEITPKGLGGGGVSVSPDQVLVGVEQPAAEEPLALSIALKLVLGDAVRIEGFGLKTRIAGAVDVSQAPRREARGRGELRLIDGSYKAYGQDLTIETGRLLFTGGDVTVPAVDMYATRHPRDDITVGVRVRGTLAKPELSLQSSPPLPREQQLAWLVLGRSLETSSTQDRGMMQNAALSLGLGGGDYVASLIGKRIGLDEVSLGSAVAGGSEVAANAQTISGAQAGAGSAAANAGATAAQLTLGKYLTPRLYVSYGVSLFQPGYTVRMLYTLGHGFKLSTESGTASGGDLIYSTERGKRPKPAVPAEAAK